MTAPSILEPSALAVATGGNPAARAAVYRLVDCVKAFAGGEQWARDGIILNSRTIKERTGKSVDWEQPWQLLGGKTIREALAHRPR